MIKIENITINDRMLTRTYSDSGYYIQRDGVRYAEAIDPAGSGRTYTETDDIIESDLDKIKAEAYDIMTGMTGCGS